MKRLAASATGLARDWVGQSNEALLDCALSLAEEACTGISGGVLVATGDLPDASDAAKITVGAQWGCTCKDCLNAALRAVADAFGAKLVGIEAVSNPGGPVMAVH
jgi:purine-nucleoside phosphorylase